MVLNMEITFVEWIIKRKLKERIMIMKDKEVLRERLIETFTKNEASYSRIYQHTQDDSTFAIIGCEDKDTKEDRSKELYDLIWKYNKRLGRGIGFNKAKGMYTYQNSTNARKNFAYEKSFILYDISREIALDIANKLNQESIVWKDKDFFGILYADGSIMLEFENKPGNNMNFKGDKGFGTQLLNDKSTKLGFAFEGVIYYSVVSDGKINTVEESFVFFSK